MSKSYTEITGLSREQLELLRLRMKQIGRKSGSPLNTRITAQSRESNAFPLSFQQQRLWFLHQLDPDNPAYNLVVALRLKGDLNVVALERSLNAVVHHHESLRTYFTVSGDNPTQVILTELKAELQVIEMRLHAERDRFAKSISMIEEEARRPFDIFQAPLCRFYLYRLEDSEHILFINVHHIISDGWSTGVLVRQLIETYLAYTNGAEPRLKRLRIQYADYAVWQQEWLNGEELQAQLRYWKEQLRSAPAGFQLPTDRPRPAAQTYRGAVTKFAIERDQAEALKQLARAEEATLFMVMLGAFKALLYRYTGEEDIIVGTPIANRKITEVEDVIGFFVNTLAFRTRLSGRASFRELLKNVRDTAVGAYSHQDMPFEKLVEELQPERDPGRSPLFQIMFIMQNLPTRAINSTDLAAEFLEIDNGAAKFELTLEINEPEEGLIGRIEYNRDIFDRATIERMTWHLKTLLGGLAVNSDEPIANLPLLTPEERRQLSELRNGTDGEERYNQAVSRQFEMQAERIPEAIAVEDDPVSLTYRELNAEANRLANYLKRLGVKRETRVGIYLERSIDMVVGVLGVMKAGGAYVPLDPSHPQERVSQIIEDVEPAIVITSETVIDSLPETDVSVVILDRAGIIGEDGGNPAEEIEPEDLVYLIYTSGSTGRPKGVQITHGGLTNFLNAMKREPGMEEGEVMPAMANLGFDIAGLELFLPLMIGARVAIVNRETTVDGAALSRKIKECGAMIIQATPVTWRMLMEAGWRGGQRIKALCGGEALAQDLADKLSGETEKAWNVYGPTETTVWATIAPIEGVGRRIDLGHPIDNVYLYVVDNVTNLMPVGMYGELCISGAGLSRGYLQARELTAEKFIPDAFGKVPGGRLYRTGDVVRRRGDGSLDFIGRKDHQVKVRGHRIEVGEIEAALMSHQSVRKAVVTAREVAPGDKRLIAYLVAEEPGPHEIELSSWLRKRLPEYMLPWQYVYLTEMPVSANGKIDRGKLPVTTVASGGEKYEAARTPTEELIVSIWGDVLRRDKIGIHDNFFTIGGHSLSAARIIARIRDAVGVELPLRRIFELSTAAELAETVDNLIKGGEQVEVSPIGSIDNRGQLPPAEELSAIVEQSSKYQNRIQFPPIKRIDREGKTLRISFNQERFWFQDQLDPGLDAYHLSIVLRLKGNLKIKALESACREVIRRHENLRTVFTVIDGNPVQILNEPPEIGLPFIDLTSIDESRLEAVISILSNNAKRRPFNLSQGPLLRVELLRLGPDEHVMFATIHHIVSDGWSLGILIREAATLYGAYIDGQGSPLKDLSIQYADYTEWQRIVSEGEWWQRQLNYWKGQLSSAPPSLQLPTDRTRPAVQTYRGAMAKFIIERDQAEALRRLALAEDATLFMVMLGVFKSLLHRYTGDEDIIVGTPVSTRNRSDLEELIGVFINPAAIRVRLTGETSFRELLGLVKEAALGAQAHSDLPFERMIEALQADGAINYLPLFQVMFLFQNTPYIPQTMRDVELSWMETTTETAIYDVLMEVSQQEESIIIQFNYRADLFDSTTIDRMINHYRTLLNGATSNPERRLRQMQMLTESELVEILEEWNDTKTELEEGRSYAEWFERQAARTSGAVAAACADEQITYGELNRRANRLAWRLSAEGIGPEAVVAVSVERNLDWLIAIIGIFKAGGVYLPLDLQHPAARIQQILQQSRAQVVVCDVESRLRAALGEVAEEGHPRVVSTKAVGERDGNETDPPVTQEASNLAYVIYTSGSTGAPKGAMIEQRGMCNHLTVKVLDLQMTASDRVAQTASQSFDISVWQLLGVLLCGGRVEIVPDEIAHDPERLIAEVEQKGITILESVPSLLRMMMGAGRRLDGGRRGLKGLRRMIVTGEAAAPELCVEWLEKCGEVPLLNAYGPTECSDDVTHYEIGEVSADGRSIPIGRPVANLRLYILDRHLEPLPIGVGGELMVGGAGVGRGYLHDAARTGEVFIPAPYGGEVGGRLYRTGDVARYLAGGNVEFMGRSDQQVKLRGFRIEIDEIQTVLARHEMVRECAVLVREDEPGEKLLVAYFIPNSDGHDLSKPGTENEVISPQVDQWQMIFDQTYQGSAPEVDPTFNTIGWNSSYTNQPISNDEMKEWVDGAVERIVSLRPERVLEIGCGSGMILSRVAHLCEEYWATDISPSVLDFVEKSIHSRRSGDCRIKLLERAADDFSGIEAEKFNLVILNGVIQYFPNAEYLIRVLEGAINAVGPNGSIFLGGVRNFHLWKEAHSSFQFHRSSPLLSIGQLRERISKQLAREKELLLAPQFFFKLKEVLPKIKNVRIELARGRNQNELTRFRYDVILQTQSRSESEFDLKLPGLDWQADGMTLENTARVLLEQKPEILSVLRVPNARLSTEMELSAILSNADESEGLEELKREIIRRTADAGIDPMEIWEIGAETGYETEVCWTWSGRNGDFDVLFKRPGNSHSRISAAEIGFNSMATAAGDLKDYANVPVAVKTTSKLSEELSRYLKEFLPVYMAPAVFVEMSQFPLTPNGKLDRKALPAPQLSKAAAEIGAEPRTQVEEIVAGIWSTVLDAPQIGLHDNFFELGGHSLLGTQVISRLREAFQVEIPLRRLFEAPTIQGLSRVVEQAMRRKDGIQFPPIKPFRSEKQVTPLSFAQQRLWFLYQLEPDNPAYNVPLSIGIQGALNLAALEQSLIEILRRHDVLRTNFVMVDRRPVQIVTPPKIAGMPLIDLEMSPKDLPDSYVVELCRQEARRSFDLVEVIPFRFSLIRSGENECILMLTIHHIVSDAWSMNILIDEMVKLYLAFSTGQPSPLPELEIQYADYTEWQRQWLQGRLLNAQFEYWRNQLNGATGVVDLPVDKPRPVRQTYNGMSRAMMFSKSLTQSLRELSRHENATLFMTLLAGFNCLLYYHTKQDDLIVGSPVAGRSVTEIEYNIGFFVNMIALRTSLGGDPTFRSLIDRVRKTTLGAYAHQDLPFDKLIEELRVSRPRNRTPLFQIAFSLDNTTRREVELSSLTLNVLEIDNLTTRFDLVLALTDNQQGMLGALQYNTDLFEASTVDRMIGNFDLIMNIVSADPNITLSRINSVLDETNDKQLVLNRMNFRDSRRRMLQVAKTKGQIVTS